jgi:protein SCO1/2
MRRICKSFTAILAIIAAPIFPSSASARVTLSDYSDVGISIPANASVPLSARVIDATGKPRNLNELMSHPTVLVFADYTCRTLCGPVVEFVGSALEKSGLHPAEQFQFLVVGLDPKDNTMDSDEMRRAHINAGSPLDKATEFVTADQSTIQMLTQALGYRYKYDQEDDQYVHAAAAYVLDASGRVVRVLTGIGLSSVQMRLALVEASAGKIGTFRDQVRLLCSGFDPAHGVYNLMIWRILEFAALATILVMGIGIFALFVADRRRAA